MRPCPFGSAAGVAAPAIRYHGAKFRLAPWIIGKFPPHDRYVEPFGGAAGVLLQKPRCYAEVYNDLDGDVVNFFRVLRDPVLRARLIDACIMTPYARGEFESAWISTEDDVERARRLAVRAQMGFGSAGASKAHTGFRIDMRRKYGTASQLWARFPEAIAAAGLRFEGVMIENRDALEVMRQHDGPDTLHYVDPPYLHSTRKMGSAKRTYRYELSDSDHQQLIEAVHALEGMVVLSGYPSRLYADALEDWTLFRTSAQISAGRGADSRTECAWLNPACAAAIERSGFGLFGADRVRAREASNDEVKP